MAEPLTAKEARAKFRAVVNQELAELTPQTRSQWILLSAVTGFVAGSLAEYSAKETRKRIAPLLKLLDALDTQMKENDRSESVNQE
jgi:hypothetical protein